jgi:hypothetical protein
MLMIDYLEDGSTSFPFELPLMAVGFMFFFLFLFFLNLSNAIIVARVTRSKNSLRALYFFIFYPILLLSFFAANYSTDFKAAFIFGFPIFVVGALLLIYNAVNINKEARLTFYQNMRVIHCTNCRYPVQMHQLDPERRCPVCGEEVKNVFFEDDNKIKSDQNKV